MGTVQLLFFFNFAIPSFAVVCYGGNTTAATIARSYGGMIVLEMNLSLILAAFVGLRMLCSKTSAGTVMIARFASAKFFIGEVAQEMRAFFSEYHCNYPYVQEWPKIYKSSLLASWKNKSITCGGYTDCIACHYSKYSTYAKRRCAPATEFTSVESFMQPQSCARFESDKNEGSVVKCLCDTGHNCDAILMEEQQLRSEAVTCLMGDKGDFCYIKYDEYLMKSGKQPERGCITNNETLSPRLYQPGYFMIMGNYELIICNKNRCNKNVKKAKKYVKMTEPSCPAPAITAMTDTNWDAWGVTKSPSIWGRLAYDLIATITGYVED